MNFITGINDLRFINQLTPKILDLDAKMTRVTTEAIQAVKSLFKTMKRMSQLDLKAICSR
jgi:hypothetical protein